METSTPRGRTLRVVWSRETKRTGPSVVLVLPPTVPVPGPGTDLGPTTEGKDKWDDLTPCYNWKSLDVLLCRSVTHGSQMLHGTSPE